jgi:transposase InsO family protein
VPVAAPLHHVCKERAGFEWVRRQSQMRHQVQEAFVGDRLRLLVQAANDVAQNGFLHGFCSLRGREPLDFTLEARASIGRYLDFYNRRRPHSSLDGTTPDHAYFIPLPFRMAA